MVSNLPWVDRNLHRKFQLDILKTAGVVYGMTDTHKDNRQLIFTGIFGKLEIV